MIDLDRPEPEPCPAAFDWMARQLLETVQAPDVKGLHVSHAPDPKREFSSPPQLDKLPTDDELLTKDAAAALGLTSAGLRECAHAMRIRPSRVESNNQARWLVSDLRRLRAVTLTA